VTTEERERERREKESEVKSRGLLCGVETCVSFNVQGGILHTYYCVCELKLFWDWEGKKTRGHGHFEVKFSV
jgi:hypothetical protein